MPRRAPLLSSLLLALTACVPPPSSADANKAGAKNASGDEAAATAALMASRNPFKPDPAFEGEPLNNKELPGGLIVEDFVIGEGQEVGAGWEVSLHYYGTLEDGTMFDTSQKRKRPFTFILGQGGAIKGWDQGIPGMKVGGKRRLTIPPELGYGKRKKGKIPPNSQLTFTVELVKAYPPLPDPKGPEAFAGEPLSKTELPGALIAEDFVVGTGEEAVKGKRVSVHYTGKLDDGTTFDTSIERKKAISFVLGTGRVIKGWEVGIEGMKVGGLRRLTVPPELGYGSRKMGKIPANSRLTFTVELMAVREAPPQRARPQMRSPRRPASTGSQTPPPK